MPQRDHLLVFIGFQRLPLQGLQLADPGLQLRLGHLDPDDVLLLCWFFVLDAPGFLDEGDELLLLHVMDRPFVGNLRGDLPQFLDGELFQVFFVGFFFMGARRPMENGRGLRRLQLLGGARRPHDHRRPGALQRLPQAPGRAQRLLAVRRGVAGHGRGRRGLSRLSRLSPLRLQRPGRLEHHPLHGRHPGPLPRSL